MERVKMGQASSTVAGAACHPCMSPDSSRSRMDPFPALWGARHPNVLAHVSIHRLVLPAPSLGPGGQRAALHQPCLAQLQSRIW